MFENAAARMPNDYFVNTERFVHLLRMTQIELAMDNCEVAFDKLATLEGLAAENARRYPDEYDAALMPVSAASILSRAYRCLGRMDEAYAVLQNLMPTLDSLRESHPSHKSELLEYTVFLRQSMSEIMQIRSGYAASTGDLLKAVDAGREWLSIEDSNMKARTSVRLALRGLAIAYYESGDYENARSWYDEYFAFRNKYWPDSRPTWDRFVQRAISQFRTGEFVPAEATLLKYEQVMRGKHDSNSTEQTLASHQKSIEFLQDLYQAWGKPEEASKWAQKLMD
ncbi:MAG: tetratricopeptide repeat protein [Planctomycetaceae bacterium]|nr:tetratricopeptide repeat protein [Planctomycetaceae bacterium]